MLLRLLALAGAPVELAEAELHSFVAPTLQNGRFRNVLYRASAMDEEKCPRLRAGCRIPQLCAARAQHG
jgi:hypothetical protein